MRVNGNVIHCGIRESLLCVCVSPTSPTSSTDHNRLTPPRMNGIKLSLFNFDSQDFKSTYTLCCIQIKREYMGNLSLLSSTITLFVRSFHFNIIPLYKLFAVNLHEWGILLYTCTKEGGKRRKSREKLLHGYYPGAIHEKYMKYLLFVLIMENPGLVCWENSRWNVCEKVLASGKVSSNERGKD